MSDNNSRQIEKKLIWIKTNQSSVSRRKYKLNQHNSGNTHNPRIGDHEKFFAYKLCTTI